VQAQLRDPHRPRPAPHSPRRRVRSSIDVRMAGEQILCEALQKSQGAVTDSERQSAALTSPIRVRIPIRWSPVLSENPAVTLYDLSGRVRLAVSSGDERVQASVARQLDPFPALELVPGVLPDVVLDFDRDPAAAWTDVQNPARDGMTTATDGRGLSVLAGGCACSLLPTTDGGPLVLRCSSDFPVGPLFRRLVRPALQTVAVGKDTVAVHSAAVEIDGRAVLVAGWSESGKTETALALMEAGARWISDKWTFLGGDGAASAFPVNVGVRRWVLPHLPRLADALPRGARAQLTVAAGAALVTSPLRRGSSRGGRVGAAAALAERATGLADRAALSPSAVRAAYGQDDDATRRVPVGAVALLTTVPGPEITVEQADPGWAASRLALTGAYERHDWYLLHDRWRYADPSRAGDERERAVAAECRLLERALAGAQVLSVRAPFPVNPGRVAAAVRAAM
jgi:hypothetical protein